MRTHLRRLSDDRGMSVIELSVASTLLMIILVAVFSLLDSASTSERGQQARHDALLETRNAMSRMTREIRQSFSVDPASTRTRLAVETIVSGVTQDVVYQLTADGEILRTIGTATSGVTLATGVTNAFPFCFDPDSACTAVSPPPTLTKVRINLSVLPTVSGARPVTLATDVELRNL